MNLHRWIIATILGIVSVLTLPVGLRAQDTQATPCPTPCTLEQLACLSWPELECLYRSAAAGNIPCGYLRGKALYCPDERFARVKSKSAALLWRGKIFDPCSETIINQWRGFRAVRARVYSDCSWLDGGPAIIMDYQGMSRVVWADVRDEMREVAPGLYLGVMFQRHCPEPRLKMFFALQVEPGYACGSCAPPDGP